MSKCSNPSEFLSALPIHQDGSCNGLQHYAALGRDELGGKAVNLAPAETPQDVYSKVLEIVLREIEKDVLIPNEGTDEARKRKGRCARLVQGHVTRKVIKQTVMTSVYGVTSRGARDQIHQRLLERLVTSEDGLVSEEIEEAIGQASK